MAGKIGLPGFFRCLLLVRAYSSYYGAVGGRKAAPLGLHSPFVVVKSPFFETTDAMGLFRGVYEPAVRARPLQHWSDCTHINTRIFGLVFGCGTADLPLNAVFERYRHHGRPARARPSADLAARPATLRLNGIGLWLINSHLWQITADIYDFADEKLRNMCFYTQITYHTAMVCCITWVIQ